VAEIQGGGGGGGAGGDGGGEGKTKKVKRENQGETKRNVIRACERLCCLIPG